MLPGKSHYLTLVYLQNLLTLASLELRLLSTVIQNILIVLKYLEGNHLTKADWRLFTTLIRFDAVYVGHFKCNKKQIKDYPHLFDYLKRLYHYPAIKDTVFMNHIKSHYYESHANINPTGIIPAGPELPF